MTILANPAVARIAAYAVPKHGAPIDLKLDANEGAPPSAQLFSALTDPELIRRYPDARSLEQKLARRLGVSPERVLSTGGADDALDRACRTFLWPGREFILPVPTFEMLPRFAALLGATIREIAWPSGPYPLELVLQAVNENTAAIAVVSPNNPTGAAVSCAELQRLAEAAPDVILLVDLAYAEYADEDLTETALALPNAIVFRTLSKAWGLAGLRVGYAVGPAEAIGWLRAAGGPYAVTGPSIALASAWVEQGEEAMTRAVSQVQSERERLRVMLNALGADALPSQANFVLARPRDMGWLRDGLAGLGIAIRSWTGHPQLDGFVRIACPASEPLFERLCAALEATLAPEALLFDMDGVLADVTRSYRQAILSTAASFGVTVTHEDVTLAKTRGDANNDWLLTHRLIEAAGVSANFEAVKARFEALYQGETGTPGLSGTETLLCTPGLLERLQSRLPLGIVTGRPRRDALQFIERNDIGRYFKSLVCMEDAPLKPDPAPILLALRALDVRRAWFIGDTPDDVSSARRAGVVPLGFNGRGLTDAGAARILQSLDELEHLLP